MAALAADDSQRLLQLAMAEVPRRQGRRYELRGLQVPPSDFRRSTGFLGGNICSNRTENGQKRRIGAVFGTLCEEEARFLTSREKFRVVKQTVQPHEGQAPVSALSDYSVA